jgi:PAS domain S-box-containing protein
LRQSEELLRRVNTELEQHVDERTNQLRAANEALEAEVNQRKRSQGELQAAALYARSLLEASLDPLVTISPDGGITDVNKATEKVTGVARAQLIDSDFSDYFTEPTKARAGYLRVLAEGEVRDYPLTIRHVSGRTIDVLYNATVYHDEDGEVQGVFAAARDVTERLAAERRTNFTRDLLDLFAHKSSRKEYLDAVVDALGAWTGCRCRGIRVRSEQDTIPYESVVGFSPDFLAQENCLSLSGASCACVRVVAATPEPPDRCAMTPGGSFHCQNAQEFVAQLTPQQQARFRGVCVRAGFTTLLVVPLRYHGRTIGALHLADERPSLVPPTDVEFIESMAGPLIAEALHRFNVEDELRRNYQTLYDSEEQYRSLVTATAQVVWNTNAAGQVDGPLPLWCDFTGQTEEQSQGRGWIESLHPDDRQRTAAVWNVAVKDRTLYDTEYRLRRRDGEYRYVAVRGVPVLAQDGAIREWVGTCTDITERRQAEEELDQHRRHLEELVKQRTLELETTNESLRQTAEDLTRSNRDLEQFAYVASHDLQEPLRIVAGYLQLLERRYKGKLDADADEFINFTVDGAGRMQKLINDLLAYSRVGTQGKQFVSVDCQAVLDRALANLRAAIAASGAVVTHDPLPTVTGDAGQLVQLFQNLIANAVKFRGQKPAQIHVGARRQDSHWVFSVQDNGIGIEQQYFDRIFVIFQRLHGREQYPGTGIGLAICKRIVERHGGKIWVESESGKGSTFSFVL